MLECVVVSDQALTLSVVLPIYNELANIEPEVTRIRSSLEAEGISFEIIAVDDGSSDGSGELLETLDGVRIIRFVKNRGAGFARRIATMEARGEYVAWTDVDMTYPNDDFPRLMKEIDGWDHVVGARVTEEGTFKFLRVPAKWLIRKLASFLTSTRIPDLNSGMRIFRRDVALQFMHLIPTGFSCVTTLTMAFLANDYSVKFVPIEYSKRRGQSKFHPIKDTQRYLLQVVRMTMLYNPLRIFLPVGLILTLLGSAKVVYDIITKNFRFGTNTLGLLVVALFVLVLGMLADAIVQQTRGMKEVLPAKMVDTSASRAVDSTLES